MRGLFWRLAEPEATNWRNSCGGTLFGLGWLLQARAPSQRPHPAPLTLRAHAATKRGQACFGPEVPSTLNVAPSCRTHPCRTIVAPRPGSAYGGLDSGPNQTLGFVDAKSAPLLKKG